VFGCCPLLLLSSVPPTSSSVAVALPEHRGAVVCAPHSLFIGLPTCPSGRYLPRLLRPCLSSSEYRLSSDWPPPRPLEQTTTDVCSSSSTGFRPLLPLHRHGATCMLSCPAFCQAVLPKSSSSAWTRPLLLLHRCGAIRTSLDRIVTSV
jgi:hypothetical protein